METLTFLLDAAVDSFEDRIAIRSTLDENTYTYLDLRTKAFSISNALRTSNVQPGDKVAIISDNIPEFLFADYGVLYCDATSVPIDQNLYPLNLLIEYLNTVDPKAILIQQKHYDKFKFEISQWNRNNRPVLNLEAALKAQPRHPGFDIQENNAAAIIFSSGSSAESERSFKAVQLTHKNIASNILACHRLIDLVKQTYMTGIARHWHSFEYMVQKAMLCKGKLLHYTNVKGFQKGDGAKINPDCALIIPRIANMIMGKVVKEVRSKGRIKSCLFNSALKNSAKLHKNHLHKKTISITRTLLDHVSDKIFYQRIRIELAQKLGNNKPLLVGGSAALPIQTQEFFYSMGLPIFQGYGLTETSPVVSVNIPLHYRFGSSGKLILGVDVKIIDPDTMNGLEDSKSGLIVVKGPNIFEKYVKEPNRTSAAFHNGWFNTGDLGYLDKDGYLYITGRLDRLIVLENGENVNPTPIEAFYENRNGISRLICVGHGKKYISTLVVLSEEIYQAINAKSTTIDYVLNHLKQELSSCRSRFGTNIGQVGIIDYFNEQKYVTATHKLRFNLFLRDHAEVIENMYK